MEPNTREIAYGPLNVKDNSETSRSAVRGTRRILDRPVHIPLVRQSAEPTSDSSIVDEPQPSTCGQNLNTSAALEHSSSVSGGDSSGSSVVSLQKVKRRIAAEVGGERS